MQSARQPPESALPSEVAGLVQEAVRAERERIAKTLHATTCQDLTGAYLTACATARQCRKLAPEMEQKLNRLAEGLQEAGNRLRTVVHSLESEESSDEEER